MQLALIVPVSNLDGQGTRPVGARGVSGFGGYDMAGNVREWCVNDVGRRIDSYSAVDGATRSTPLSTRTRSLHSIAP